jgi:RimJ/RimL family protein N-acetyltransferase
MERNQMRREAHFVKNRDGRGKWVDELVYAILKEEWENNTMKSF